jgi:hypothetical protein
VKPASPGALNADFGPIEDDLAAPIIAIFERELVVSDIGVYPYLNADQCEQIYNEAIFSLAKRTPLRIVPTPSRPA